MEIMMQTIGWIASFLILIAYFMNSNGRWNHSSPLYIWCNLIGGLFFIANTVWLKAYPSALVNVIWVIIALVSLFKKPAAKAV
jgi:hypothetical protein